MDSLFSLAGKKAVITGCATGIGKGMAAGLARAGADIIALDIGDLEDTRRTVENLGRECRCYHVDLSVSSDVDEVWIRLLEEGAVPVVPEGRHSLSGQGVERENHQYRLTFYHLRRC